MIDLQKNYSINARRMKRSVIRELLKLTAKPDIISFAGGLPAPETFPTDELIEVCESILKNHGARALQYGPTEGIDLLKDQLVEWAGNNNVRLPVIPAHCDQPYHMFYLLLPSEELRDGLIQHLRQAGILSVFHYLPLHLSTMGRQFGGKPGDCPITEDISSRLLRLPFYNDLTDSDLSHIITKIKRFSPT